MAPRLFHNAANKNDNLNHTITRQQRGPHTPPSSINDNDTQLLMLILSGFVGIFVLLPGIYFGRHVLNRGFQLVSWKELSLAWQAALDTVQATSSLSIAPPLTLLATTVFGMLLVQNVAVPLFMKLVPLVIGKDTHEPIAANASLRSKDDEKEATQDENNDTFPFNICIQDDDKDKFNEYPILLTKRQRCEIAKHVLPRAIQHDYTWQRLYSVARDGDTFAAFLHKVQGHSRTMLVAKTTATTTSNDPGFFTILGAFCDVEWKASGPMVYDCGVETKLFCFAPNQRQAKEKNESLSSSLQVYPWTTETNRYHVVCDRSKQRIAMSVAGQNSFAWCIDSNFTRITSSAVKPPLIDNNNDDGYSSDIVDLEVYGFRIL